MQTLEIEHQSIWFSFCRLIKGEIIGSTLAYVMGIVSTCVFEILMQCADILSPLDTSVHFSNFSRGLFRIFYHSNIFISHEVIFCFGDIN